MCCEKTILIYGKMIAKLSTALQNARFSLCILFLLTFQSAGVTILATLTQQGAVSCPIADGELVLAKGKVCRYSPVHVLATAEVIKLIVAFLWTAVVVYIKCTATPKDSGGAGEEAASLLSCSGGDNNKHNINSIIIIKHGNEHLESKSDSEEDDKKTSHGAAAAAVKDTTPIVVLVADDGDANLNSTTSYRARHKLIDINTTAESSEERLLGSVSVSVVPPSTGASINAPLALLQEVEADNNGAVVRAETPLDGLTAPTPSSSSSASTTSTSSPARLCASPATTFSQKPLTTFPNPGNVFFSGSTHLLSAAFWRAYLPALRSELGFTRVKIGETFIMALPAVLYAMQNTMVLISLQLVDPAFFQLCSLIRILFLAVLMRVFLKLQLTVRQCIALVLLTVGIGFAQWSPPQSTTAAATAPGIATTSVVLILCAALISSGTGVFLEAVFKNRGHRIDLCARNVHLAFFSIVVYLCKFLLDFYTLSGELAIDDEETTFALQNGAVLYGTPEDAHDVYVRTFFQGFTGLVWCLVLMQALAGFLLALVLKYSNNIMKTFSTSLALLISMAASVVLFGTTLQTNFLVGAVLVLISVFMYNLK